MPRSTIEDLLGTLYRGDYARATNYFDLSQPPTASLAPEATKLARELRVIAHHRLRIKLDQLSVNPAGASGDGLPPSQDRFGRIDLGKGPVDLLLERVPRADGVLLWKISPRTVARIPELYEELSYHVLEALLPAPAFEALLGRRFLGLPLPEAITFAIFFIVFVAVLLVVSRLVLALLRRIRPGFFYHFLHRIYVPTVLLIVVLIFRSFIRDSAMSDEELKLYQSETILILAVVWLVARLVDFAGDRGRYELTRRGHSSSVPLLNLARRTSKMILLILGFTIWLENLGFKIATILAGLGVAGIAVGLAGQKLIEDLFGAITLYSTQRVKRDDFIRFGDRLGIVEDIGLRVTSIRSLDRTLITVPNGVFAHMEIENYAHRDRIWYHPRLGLRYETTPDQLRYILVETRKLLYGHPKVRNEGARIRFAGFGAYSLDLDIFCYVDETDYAQYLGVAEDLNLRIMDVVTKAGSGFAFPSQTTYFERGSGLDSGRARQAEAEVRRWRAEQQLYLPAFPLEKIKELDGTVEFPPAGSPEAEGKSSTQPSP